MTTRKYNDLTKQEQHRYWFTEMTPSGDSLMVGLWITPHMTIGHVLLSAGMTIYILIGVHFEERSLAKELGADYERYQARTPKFLPV